MSGHCERCRGLGDRPLVPKERNLALETFLAAWAKREGYTVTIAHAPKRSTARFTVEGR